MLLAGLRDAARGLARRLAWPGPSERHRIWREAWDLGHAVGVRAGVEQGARAANEARSAVEEAYHSGYRAASAVQGPAAHRLVSCLRCRDEDARRIAELEAEAQRHRALIRRQARSLGRAQRRLEWLRRVMPSAQWAALNAAVNAALAVEVAP